MLISLILFAKLSQAPVDSTYVLTKHGPQVADSEIGKSAFESKNKSLSSDFIS